MPDFEPTIDECKTLVLDFLRADDEYRRDLGAFGPDDKRTVAREQRLWWAKSNLRGWYGSRFGTKDLST